MKEYEGKIIGKNYLQPNIIEFKINCSIPLSFAPGDFISIKILFDNKFCYRAYSVAGFEENIITLLVKIIEGGKGSFYLNNLNIGDTITFTGPFGNFLRDNDPSEKKIFIATSTGIAPFLFYFTDSLRKNNKTSLCLLWGLKKKEDIFYLELLEKFKASLFDFDYNICLSKESEVKENPLLLGRITNNLDKIELGIKNIYYLCGKKEMIDEISNFLQNNGISPQKIKFERFN